MFNFSSWKKDIAQEHLPTCRGGAGEHLLCGQHFHAVYYRKWSFAFPDNFSLRKSKQFSLRLLLISHYKIRIRDLLGICQQNSCWSRCVDTAQCCNVLVISVLKIKSGIICSMSRCQSAADQGVLA